MGASRSTISKLNRKFHSDARYRMINWDTIICDRPEERIGMFIQDNYVILDECVKVE